MAPPDFDAAARFVAAEARILDRRRLDHHFGGGAPAAVRDAVAAYRNPDGGFAHGLEPDDRSSGSQPLAIEAALRHLHQCDAWDQELVAGALGWLERNAAAGGGAVFVEASVEGGPHAPWLRPDPARPASLISTGLIAATLHAQAVEHPWLARATELMWERIAALADPHPYEARGALAFLQQVPDRERATEAAAAIGRLVRERGLVELDPEAPGEVHGPLDYAPLPDSLARGWFDRATIEAHLDHFAASQREDGGWDFDWTAWSPATARDWRGALTVDALLQLRANGRLEGR